MTRQPERTVDKEELERRKADRHRLDDYRTTVDVWRQYVDTRFNLLRLVPLATGVGVAFIADRPSAESALVAVGALVSLFGILMYDLRNSVLHDAIVHRAKALEDLLDLDRVSGVQTDMTYGGPFTDRPAKRVKFMGVLGWHDRALNIVYSASAAAWTVVLVVSLLAELQWPANSADQWLLAAWIGVLAFAGWFYAIAKWDRDAGVERGRMRISDRTDVDHQVSGGQRPDTRQAQ